MFSPSKRWQVRAATSMDRLGAYKATKVFQDPPNVTAAIKGPRRRNYEDGVLVTSGFTFEGVACFCVLRFEVITLR